MQPFIAAMLIKVRKAFYAAIIKSFLRTKSLLQAILKIWVSPSLVAKSSSLDRTGNVNGNGSAIIGTEDDGGEDVEVVVASNADKRTEEFLDEVEGLFREPTSRLRLVALSSGLRAQFEDSLLENTLCMLPSYNHQLPTGDECGTYLGLDVGGSTFRVALIELSGGKSGGKESIILKRDSFKIDYAVKQLEGLAFFDWMADRIEDTLSGQAEGHEMTYPPLSMGLAWSFPIEQTSLRSGLVLGMGKNFNAVHGILGQDLADLIQDACSRKGLNVHLNAIVNDSSACLLSKAYHDPTTRFALILGTGLNAAVHLPVHIFSPSKFGTRPRSWHDSAKHVIVNTELSMFGAAVLPFTRWDRRLVAVHPRPDFQPMEYMVSGGYLGEIVRLVLVEGIQTAGLFEGFVPVSLREPYSLESETLSRMESDSSLNLESAHDIFVSRHPTPYPPSHADIQAIRIIASHVIHRASSIIAAGVHSLWQLRNDAESVSPSESSHTLVAYNGSVLENYPGFRATCQAHLDTLVEASGASKGTLELMPAEESSLLGAAVAVACLENGL